MDKSTGSGGASEGSGSAVAEPEGKRGRWDVKHLDGILAALVTVYGILTAVVIFMASGADGLYYDNVFIAQAQLNDASELAIEAQIGILHDLSVLEQIQVHILEGSDEEIIDYLYGQLSAEAVESLERSAELDDVYAERVFAVHNAERENAMISFDLAGAWSERAGVYQGLATVLAVGLAFAAWASLMEKGGCLRVAFAVVALLVLIACLGFLGVHLIIREPLEEYGAAIPVLCCLVSPGARFGVLATG